MKTNRRPLLMVSAAAALFLAGCNVLPQPAPDNRRYFVLESRAGAAAESREVTVGLRPVEISAYLKHKALAVRRGDHELEYATDARWAEPLEAGLARILREQLARRVRVVAYPFPAQTERDFDVTVSVLAAEGTPNGINFSAVFEIVRAGEKSGWVTRRNFTTAGSNWNGDFDRLAGALSDAASELADGIVAALPEN